jgi:hypothetical protein
LYVAILSAALCLPAALASALPTWVSSVSLVAGPAASPWTRDGDWLVANVAVTENDDGSITFGPGSWVAATGVWELEWDEITVKADPQVSFIGTLTNTTALPQDFVFAVSTPVTPALPSSLYGGSTSVTVGDTNDDGATLQNTTGQPGYAGVIDGATNQLLLLNPFSLAAPPSGTNSLTQWSGLPATLPGPAVNTSIGISHRFNLTAQDQATFNSTFNVVIPEPGTLALLGVGLGALGRLGRRRHA